MGDWPNCFEIVTYLLTEWNVIVKIGWITSALVLAITYSPAHATIKTARCDLMHKLAQEHANDMARRETLDHAGFAMRARLGARAENVAMGHASKAKTLAQWGASARHAANMRLPGCKAVAYAISRSGRYYWVMEIGK